MSDELFLHRYQRAGAYHCPERLSHAAQKAICAIDNSFISLLMEVEFFSLLAKKTQGDFDETKARDILMLFQAHLKEGCFQILTPASAHYLKARAWQDFSKKKSRTGDVRQIWGKRSNKSPNCLQTSEKTSHRKMLSIKLRIMIRHSIKNKNDKNQLALKNFNPPMSVSNK